MLFGRAGPMPAAVKVLLVLPYGAGRDGPMPTAVKVLLVLPYGATRVKDFRVETGRGECCSTGSCNV